MARQPAGPPPMWDGPAQQPAAGGGAQASTPRQQQGQQRAQASRPAPGRSGGSGGPPAKPAGDSSEAVEVGALTVVERATLDVQIVTAKSFPRSVPDALDEALTLVTMDREVAGSMFYRLKRENKVITGPSARLAEVLAYCWKNLRIEGEVVEVTRTHVVAMGTCFDLERNVARRTRVQRRITNREGQRFSDDMIGVTGNAAVSIAARNAMVQSIPRVFVDKICQEAMQLYAGKTEDLPLMRSNAVEWYTRQGATEAQIFEFLGVKRMEDIGKDELASLRGLRNAIEEGQETLERGLAGLRGEDEEAPAKGGADELNAAIGGEGT